MSEMIYLGGGCFWCTEAVMKPVRGVEAVRSGYMGGDVPDPTYEAVCTGRTGHAEVIGVTFDPAVVSLPDLLDLFFLTHDPTTLNRQGADTGTQYRSVVFCTSDAQVSEARAAMARAATLYPDPLVTEVLRAPVFYPAEAYHQDYFAGHPDQQYCALVIAPKVSKARTKMARLYAQGES